MKKILHILWPQARPLTLLTAVLALGTLPLSLSAAILWPQPVNIFTARNYAFQGHTAASPDGSYALIWSMMNLQGDRQICFQRFSYNDQPLNPEPVVISGTEGKVPWRIIRASNGNYFILARGNQQALLLLIDPTGALVNVAFPMNWSISAQSRVELVPDLSGGAWLGLQLQQSTTPRYINHFSAAGEPIFPGFLIIPTNNNHYSDMSILVQPDNSVICAYAHRYDARVLKITSEVQITQDVTFSFSGDAMVDCKVFQDGAGNLVWVGYMDAFLYSQAIQAMKTSDEGTLLWPQAINFSNPGGTVKAWDAVALGDDTYVFGMVTQPSSSSPDLSYFGQRFNGTGSTYFGYYNQHRALEPLDAQATVQLKVIASAGGGSWGLIRKYDPNDWIYKLSCIFMSPNGINWTGEQIVHSQPLHSNFGEIGLGGFRQGSNLAMLAQTHASSQSHIVKNVISSTGTNISEQVLTSSETATMWQYVLNSIGNSVLCAWVTDVEPYLWPQKKEEIHYQLVNSQGQKLLPQDGQIISGGSNKDLERLKSLSLPDDSVLLWWVEHDTAYRLRAQLVDSSGNQIWEQGGRLILTDEALQYNRVLASYHEGDIYFIWDMEYANEIRGQRLVNGIPQWESQGRLLIDASAALYPDLLGIRIMAVDGNSLFYGCGVTYDTANGYPTCVAMWRFDSSGQGLQDFGEGGIQLLRYYDNVLKSLEFINLIKTPQGFLVQAYTWDGYYEPQIWGYVYNITGTIYQLVSLDGICSWGPEGFWTSSQYLNLIADPDGYYRCESNTIKKFDYDRNLIWSEYLGHQSATAVETQPGVYIGIGGLRDYYSFTAQGNVSWPTQSQFTSVYNPEALLTAMGGDAYILFRQKTSNYSFYDYNASPLMLQRFNRSVTAVDDPQVPALSDLITLSSAPNPFRTGVSLQVSCKQALIVEISVYNLRGQKIRDLHKGELPQGASLLTWDGKDSGGKEVAAGIYFVRIHSPRAKPFIRKLLKL
ncbi:MAG TPA: T9SS type A sorting domain-containing protein [Candidatus Cloacimonadota bacterium]|nr:T9SS type A sorting domain-containing protein [Candidatus Cloacimonadota bacterium]